MYIKRFLLSSFFYKKQYLTNNRNSLYIKFSSFSIPSFTTAHIAGNIKRLLYFYALIFTNHQTFPGFCLDNEI